MTGLRWTPREPPLPVEGCVCVGGAAEALVGRLLALDDASLARLEGSAAPGFVAVFGAAGSLPWVDGAQWLGRVAEAPALWLPTERRPDAPPELLQSAALRAVGGAGPVVLTPDRLIAVDPLPVVRAHLARWRPA